MKKQLFFYSSCLGILLLVFITYSNHFHNPFEFDDHHTIQNNLSIRSLKNIPSFFLHAETTSALPSNQAYRPGLTTLNALDFWIGGEQDPDPFYYHCSIFASFLVLGALLFFFLLRLFQLARPHPWNQWFALLGTAFFLLHTANAETINYIIARGDSFSTLMVLLAFVIYQYKPLWRPYLIYLFPILAGFFVKEPVVMFPPLLFFYVLFFPEEKIQEKGTLGSRVPTALKAMAPSLILASGLFLFSRTMTPAHWTSGNTDTWHYLITQPFVIIHYFNNFLLPLNLSADTDWTLIRNVVDDRVLVGTGFIGVLLWIASKLSRTDFMRPVAFGIAWFLLALVPTSSVFPFAEVLNDHRTFFPYIGLAMAATWAFARLVYKFESSVIDSIVLKSLFLAVPVIVLCGHAYGTHERNKTWHSSESLWKDVVEKSPGNGRGLMNYGLALMNKGDYAGALTYFNQAKEIWPLYSYIYINLGVLYGATNNPGEAETNFKEGLALRNDNPEAYYFYARWLLTQNRRDEASVFLNQGLLLSPEHLNLRLLQKELETSVPVQRKPEPGELLNQSLAFYNAGNYEQCIRSAEKALELKPDYDLAYNNICSAYNMLKQWDKAIEAGEKGLRINPGNQLLKNNLMVSYDGKGIRKAIP